jgi:hypothetical protein
MIRLTVAWLCAGLASLFILWRESGENTAVFCYRMSSGLILAGRQRTLQGEFAACSNSYATCCTHSMTSKD